MMADNTLLMVDGLADSRTGLFWGALLIDTELLHDGALGSDSFLTLRDCSNAESDAA